MQQPAILSAATVLSFASEWLMTLGIGNNSVPLSASPYPGSIFINGNGARTLLASYKLTGNSSHLAEGLRWCDAFVESQYDAPVHDGSAMGGWWDTGYEELYIADTGTAVTALALCFDLEPKPSYLNAILKFERFVRLGTATTPQCKPLLHPLKPKCSYDGNGSEVARGFILESGPDIGAVGDGYYKQKLNTAPYTIATALSGGVVYSELLGLEAAHSGILDPEAKKRAARIAQGAVGWLLRALNQSSGTIPYVITPPTTEPHEYQCISYSAEAFIDLALRATDSSTIERLRGLNATVEYLLRKQGGDGALLPNGTRGEIQRSPRAVSLLQLWGLTFPSAASRTDNAISRYLAYLLTPSGEATSGFRSSLLATGFIGLAAADLVSPWVTFVHKA